eukprot:jgi/Botrbrau1/10976/Bobra.0234s0001.1
MSDGVVTYRCSGACVRGASSREECTRLLTVRVTGLRPFSGRVPVVAGTVLLACVLCGCWIWGGALP